VDCSTALWKLRFCCAIAAELGPGLHRTQNECRPATHGDKFVGLLVKTWGIDGIGQWNGPGSRAAEGEAQEGARLEAHVRAQGRVDDALHVLRCCDVERDIPRGPLQQQHDAAPRAGRDPERERERNEGEEEEENKKKTVKMMK
jgi:hypothetical protein